MNTAPARTLWQAPEPVAAHRGLPMGAGIGLKPAHYREVLQDAEGLAFFEVHAENHLGEGGPAASMLEWVGVHAALSVHGVGLSIGSPQALDRAHLERIARLVERTAPAEFSEHLAWSSHAGRYFNDLLPLPYHAGTLRAVCEHVDQVQTRLGRRMLLENPATYLEFATSTFDEADFLHEIVTRTGCGLLLDVANVVVSCTNHGHDAGEYIARLPLAAVGEIHLAGHAPDRDSDGSALLIDSHDRAVSQASWALYEQVLAAAGPRPTLIEWDNALPSYTTLRGEAAKANRRLAMAGAQRAP